MDYDNSFKIKRGDKLTCSKSTPCGTLEKGDTCIARSDVFSCGYGPEVTISLSNTNEQGEYIDIQTMYLVNLSELREIKLNKILNVSQHIS